MNRAPPLFAAISITVKRGSTKPNIKNRFFRFGEGGGPIGSGRFYRRYRTGGLTTDYEIRLLICYLLYKIDIPMTFDQLNSALQSEGLVNYFEFAEPSAF